MNSLAFVLGTSYRGALAMANSKSNVVVENGDSQITLGLLRSVADNSSVTQRSLASDLGIALGLANAYLKRCAKKGLIKILEAPTNRYAYYLTPQGFAEKSRLTAEFLGQSFALFRRARQEYSLILETCVDEGYNNIAIFGGSDLTEITLLCARDYAVNVVGIVATDFASSLSAGMHVVESVADLDPFDAIVLAELTDPQAAHDGLTRVLGEKKLFAPYFMNISTHRPEPSDEGEPV
jgi:DNA-binding MarR family transcriptional regulator